MLLCAYLIIYGWEERVSQFVKVFSDVLVWQITAQKGTMYFTIRTSQPGKVAFGLALLNKLEESLHIESGGWSANETLSNQVQRERI